MNMIANLIYHTGESVAGGISPFDEIIRQITSDKEISIVCPYLGIEYLGTILTHCKSWRIISDVEAWLTSHSGNSRKKVADFIIQNNAKIHHYKNLHAKVIIADNKALLGSANFTRKGILERIEMSVLIESEGQINELRHWFDNLWFQSEKVETDELQNYLGVIPEKPINEENSGQPVLSSKAPKVRAKFVKSEIEEKDKTNGNHDNRLFSEQEISDIVISRNKIENASDVIEIIRKVKNNIPQKLRSFLSVRTDKKRIQISFIMQNYLLFRLPYTGEQYKEERKSSVYLIYPKEDIDNLNGIVDAERLQYMKHHQETFAFFDCIAPMMKFKEILQFGYKNWESFQKACYMAKEARKTRNWDTNIIVEW